MKEISIEKRLFFFFSTATKVDLRQPGKPCVTTAEGETLSQQINANSFIECSAKENIQVRETVYEAVRAAVVGVKEPSHPTTEESDMSCCGMSCESCTIL